MSLFNLLQEVAPKKAKLKIAEAEYNGTVMLLEEKRSQLRTLEAQLAELHQKLKEANEQKQELEDNVSVCSNKLMRAEKLIGKIRSSVSRVNLHWWKNAVIYLFYGACSLKYSCYVSDRACWSDCKVKVRLGLCSYCNSICHANDVITTIIIIKHKNHTAVMFLIGPIEVIAKWRLG